ncbi:MAG TPA: sterol desaturase family protein [Azospirillaceae bacterium]|nr:sterol desaturase family protein [Azospirillaceae bacterium]
MPDASLPLLKALLVGGWFALFFALERLAPAAVPPEEARGWRRLGRNAALWLGNSALSLAFVLPVSAWATSQGIGWRPGWWSGWTGLALDLLVLDCWIYWWHRAAHGVPMLWRFHRVHHLDRFLDTTTGVRFHAGEVALAALVRALVILAFGIPLASVLLFETLVLLAALFQHSNLRLPPRLERALSWVVVTPSLHWMHHHADRADTDSTYALGLSVWDRLFRSRAKGVRTADMELGIGRPDEPLPRLLTEPFRDEPGQAMRPQPASASSTER